MELIACVLFPLLLSETVVVIEDVMKHKKILLVAIFLTLFVFQQVQAGGT